MMGWSSWNAYMIDISDSIIMQQADLMVSMGLKEAGYNFVNIDDGFFGYRDSTGRLITHPVRFPSGLEETVRHIHSLGLKAGIYSDAGDRTCGSWYNNDPNGFGVGLYEHDAQDVDMYFNELDFDFIKIDYCGALRLELDEETRYREIRHVMDSVAHKPVLFNLCRWKFPGTWVSEVADSWRISSDIRPVWSSVKMIVDKNKYLSAYAGGGRYNDMDMLAVGYNEHPSPFWDEGLGLSYQEEEAHFGMWCIMASPLLLGCALEYMPQRTLEIVTNPELIAVNQDVLGLQAYTVAEGVFVKDVLQRRGLTRALALYNPADTARSFAVDAAVLDLEGPLQVRDLNRREDLSSAGSVVEMTLAPHQAKILRVTGTRRLEPTRYEAEWGYCPCFTDISKKTGPKYRECADASNGAVVAGLGGSAENTLEWREVWSDKGGAYQAVVALCPVEDAPCADEQGSSSAQVVSGSCEDASCAGALNCTLTVNGTACACTPGQPTAITLRKGWNTVCVASPASPLPPLDYLSLQPASR